MQKYVCILGRMPSLCIHPRLSISQTAAGICPVTFEEFYRKTGLSAIFEIFEVRAPLYKTI